MSMPLPSNISSLHHLPANQTINMKPRIIYMKPGIVYTKPQNRLDHLPNEILEMIMELSSVATLNSLIHTSSQARALFENRPHTLLLSAISQSGLDAHTQKMYCTIISIRERQKHAGVDEKLQAYIAARIKYQTTTGVDLDLSSTPASKMIDVLVDAAKIYKEIEDAEVSVVKVQMLELTTRIQDFLSKDECLPTVNLKERQLSPTEFHRVHRALWRLRLYFEAYHEPYIPLALDRRVQSQRSEPMPSITKVNQPKEPVE